MMGALMDSDDRHFEVRELEAAWRSASDQRVSEALSHLNDLVDEAREIVQREAQRRGLGPAIIESRSSMSGINLRTAIVQLMQLTLRYRYVTVVIFSTGIVPLTMVLYNLVPSIPWVVFVAVILLILLTLAALCWPLLSYKIACIIALLATLSRGIVDTMARLIMENLYPEDIISFFPYFCGTFVLVFLVTWGLLCGLIFVRRRYWPVYQEGLCAKCGYDLRGLVEPRCPECGTPFDSPIPTPVDGQVMAS
jgi:hypothetical protein